MFVTPHKLYIASHSFLGPRYIFLQNMESKVFFLRRTDFPPGIAEFQSFWGSYGGHTDFTIKNKTQKRTDGFG